jgi:hypothetical protein
MNFLLNFALCISSVPQVSCHALETAYSLTAAVYSPWAKRISTILCKENPPHSSAHIIDIPTYF